MNSPILWAAAGTGFTFLMTAFGASLVFFFRKNIFRHFRFIQILRSYRCNLHSNVFSVCIESFFICNICRKLYHNADFTTAMYICYQIAF